MFGSVLVPIKALVLNLLSLSATFGAMVWIFQDGHLSGFLDFTATGMIDIDHADPDVLHRLRAVDGLRGVPAVPDQGGVRPDRATTRSLLPWGSSGRAGSSPPPPLLLAVVFIAFATSQRHVHQAVRDRADAGGADGRHPDPGHAGPRVHAARRRRQLVGAALDAPDLRSLRYQRVGRAGRGNAARPGRGLSNIEPAATIEDDEAPIRPARARRGEGELLREDILRAAAELFNELGSADKVSMRAIADRVGVTPPSIYLHFQTKTDLIYAACERLWDEFGEMLVAARAGIDDPLDRVQACGRAYLGFALEHPGLYRVLFMEEPEGQPEDFDVQEILSNVGFLELVGDVQQLADSGRLRPELEVVPVVLILWAAVHGVASLLVDHPKLPFPPPERALDLVFETLSHGLLVE